jgi:hypothetical protein
LGEHQELREILTGLGIGKYLHRRSLQDFDLQFGRYLLHPAVECDQGMGEGLGLRWPAPTRPVRG